MQRNSQALTWRPKGASDNLDSSQVFNGAMAALSNLIPDPSTPRLFQCRPAAINLTGGGGSPFSSGFSSGFGSNFLAGGFIPVIKVIGNYVYGLKASSAFVGHDEPFVFNLLTNNFVTVTGATNNNTPISQQQVGAWVPPTMALIGSKLIVTSPGFAGAFGNFFGYFDISVPGLPTWSGGNCVGAGFAGFSVPPTAVSRFGDRAYYIHNAVAQPAVIFSDVLSPLTNSAGGIVPVLTFGDNVPLTALGGLPLSNQLGGIIQALMVFKGVSNIFQIIGDPALGTLSVNSLNIPTGTLAPKTVVPTPKGLSFISPEGLRIIDFDAHVSDAIGYEGDGITVPFIYSNVPSRMVSGSNGSVIRISTQNTMVAGTPQQEWWYHFTRNVWTGPHTFPASNMEPYQNTFIMTPAGLPGNIWVSDYLQSVTSTFMENGARMTWAMATSFLPDTDQMVNTTMLQTTLDLALTAEVPTVTIQAFSQTGVVLGTVTVPPPGSPPLWGTAVWGQFLWGGAQSPLAPRQMPWAQEIDFVRCQLLATANSAQQFKIGAFHMRYRQLKLYVDIGAVA